MARVLMFALAGASALALVSAPALAEGVGGTGPCDEFVTYLRGASAGAAPVVPDRFDPVYRFRESHLEDSLRSTSPTMPPAYIARVTPACRAEIRRGAAPAAVAAARAWTERHEPGWIDRGRIVLCTMQDPDTLADLAAWMADADHDEARAVCAGELATWPGAESVRGSIFARVVRRGAGPWPDNWEIDPAVVAGANAIGTPELREQLVPVLAAAHRHRAFGYDRLHAAACADDGTMSGNRARACSTLPAQAEDEWRRERKRADIWAVRGGLTFAYAGAITLAFWDRDQRGRNIATAAGALGGSLVGGALVGGVVGTALCHPCSGPDLDRAKILAGGASIAGGIAGGVLGGLAAHAASPRARGPVTALGFAPLYIFTVAITFK